MVKIEDPEFWNQEVIDAGKFGFSVEGIMFQEIVKMNSIDIIIDSLTDQELLDLFN
jgi:hypothetical protein